MDLSALFKDTNGNSMSFDGDNANVNNKKASGSGVRPSESDESDDFATDDEPPMKRTRCDDNKGKGKMSNKGKRRPRCDCNPIIPNPNIRALIANPDVTNEELMEIKSTQFYTNKNGHASKALKDGAANTAKVLKMLSYGLKYNMADMLNVSGSSYCLYCLYCLLCCN